MIVIHEIFGLSDWVRGVADQLAEAGYIAIAPDLLSGLGPNGGGSEALGVVDGVRKVIGSLPAGADHRRSQRGRGIRRKAPGLEWQNHRRRILLGRRAVVPFRHE